MTLIFFCSTRKSFGKFSFFLQENFLLVRNFEEEDIKCKNEIRAERNLNELRFSVLRSFVLMPRFSVVSFQDVSRTRFYYSKGIFLNYKTFPNFFLFSRPRCSLLGMQYTFCQFFMSLKLHKYKCRFEGTTNGEKVRRCPRR